MSSEDALTKAQQTMRRFQHEVRTPLGQIIGYSELLEEELEERGQEDLAPDLHRIRSAAQRLLDLVDGKLRDEKPVGAPALPENESRDGGVQTNSESEDAALAVAGSQGAEPQGGDEIPRILVVDDEPQNRDLLARRLERNGFEVETARDGVDALRRIDAEDFDLVMLDVMMPGMNGLEVLERVRRTQSMAELPVILATALAETEDAVEGLGRGANDYVTKPFDFPMVVARVRTQLATSRSARKIAALAKQLEFRNSFIREALGREIPTELLVEISETPGALDLGHERRTVTVLSVDIQGSRRMAASLSPGQYVTLLRNTLGGLAGVVEHHGGTVDSIAGDSLAATFGLPDPTEADTARAAACALALQLEMQEINERNGTSQLPAVEISVGVATGEVVVGGFGSGDAMRFMAIGEPFLQAARIEAGGSGGEVWICDATRSRLGELAEVDLTRDFEGRSLYRLLGVGGEWLMSLRAVPESAEV
ncbi:MAG: response regulator [Deltaproteobacteria bacterium]|nr:response regulator [Deltaproteobacteria bacterium]